MTDVPASVEELVERTSADDVVRNGTAPTTTRRWWTS